MFYKILILMALCHFICEFVFFPLFLSKQEMTELYTKNGENVFSSIKAIFWSSAIELPILLMLMCSGLILLCMIVINSAIYYIANDLYKIRKIKFSTKTIINFLQILLTLILFMVIL